MKPVAQLHGIVMRHARGLNVTPTEVSTVCKVHALTRWLQSDDADPDRLIESGKGL